MTAASQRFNPYANKMTLLLGIGKARRTHYSDFLLVSMVESYGGSNLGIVGLSPFLRSEILLIKLRFFEFVVLVDPV